MKKLWVLLVIPLIVLLWWAADRKTAIPSVHFARVERKSIASIVSTNGKVEPLEYATARAEVAGFVNDVKVKRGADVSVGQVLVQLDNATQRAALDTARAQLAQAQADQAIAKQGGRASQLSDINGQLSSAQLQLSEAERNLASIQRLYAKQAATKEEERLAEANVAQKKAQISSLENNRKSLVTSTDVDISSAKLQDAQAAVALAQHNLDLTTIKAPLAGTVYQFDIKRGAFLNLGDLVAVIGNLNQMRVQVYVDEPDVGRISRDLPVEITWQARPGQKWTGHVSQLPTEIVPLQTRQVGIVTCVIENPQHELLPSTNVDVSIVSKIARDAIAVPTQAVQNAANGSGVFKLGHGGTVVWQPVTTGIHDITTIEIKSGLQAGDRVALPSDTLLVSGMKVKPLMEQASSR
jgi:HlyD family secretion protein